ncbi:thioester domain-containing protein [Actinokineospora sp. NBRC 105648]|uniref:thioester domain-containing protein n=1 Tax=Actinokineospora sp. NBRC 105648 TaxID=3032206 RepID=UPI00249FA9D2|nr:thioester domain-containing protein [Actinokineospora sp. NBRC 105648]GLZ40711.1 TQXA domain-containing protein [Actinokineospora sp. NBRC 105648]
MGSRWNLARAGAVLAVTAVSAALAAMPASAEGVTGTLFKPGDEGVGFVVRMKHGKDEVVTTPYLFNLNLSDGKKLKVYCVGLKINASYEKNVMSEVPWASYPDPNSPFNANSAKINWALHHGYPKADLAALNALGLATNADGIELEEAISATQAALWHFSDGYDIDRQNPVERGNDDSDKDVLALYDYLTGPKNVGIGEWPVGELKINPNTLSGESGKLVGPFKVTTNGVVTKLESALPDGVQLTDADGKVLKAADIKNGTQVFLKVAAGTEAGKGSFKLTADSPVIELGRLFTGNHSDGAPAQPLIVADSETKVLTAEAKGDWKVAPTTPPSTSTTTTAPSTSPTTGTTVPPTTTTTVAPAPQPKPNLPDTGASIMLPVLIGLGLLGGGAGALLYVRHRRNAA